VKILSLDSRIQQLRHDANTKSTRKFTEPRNPAKIGREGKRRTQIQKLRRVMKIAQHKQDPKHDFSIELKHDSYNHGGHRPPSLI
jgi:hypothetical protein